MGSNRVLGFTAIIAALILLGHPVASEALFEERHAQARAIFDQLVSVSSIMDKKVTALSFQPEYQTISGWSMGGCLEKVTVNDKALDAFQTPAVTLHDAVLWADRGKTVPTATYFILAHELSHLEKRLASPVQRYCEEIRSIYASRPKKEELEADQGAVLLLTKAGMDGEGIALNALEIMCKYSLMGCPESSPDHPTLGERQHAIKEMGQLLHFLGSVIEPIRIADKPEVYCTKFRLMPYESGVRDIMASAGHCWEALSKSLEKQISQRAPETICSSDAHCFRITFGHHASQTPIGLFAEDPLDFMLFWEPGRGTSAAHLTYSESLPHVGEVYYSMGISAQGVRGLSLLEYVDNNDGFLRFRYIGGYPMDEGSSGSPIVSKRREVVGISSNMLITTRETRATDMHKILPLLRAILTYAEKPKNQRLQDTTNSYRKY